MGTSGWYLKRSCRRRGSGTPLSDPSTYDSWSNVSEYRRAADTMGTQAWNENQEGGVCIGTVVLTLNFRSCFVSASFGRGHPFSIHFALAFFSCDQKFSLMTLSLTWILRALDTLISMSGSREYTGTTSNSV